MSTTEHATSGDPILGLPLPPDWVRLDLTAALDGLATFATAAEPMLASAGLDPAAIGRLVTDAATDPRLADTRLAAVWVHTDHAGTLVQANVAVHIVPAQIVDHLDHDPAWDTTTIDHPEGDTIVRRTRRKQLDTPVVARHRPVTADLGPTDMIGLADYYRTIPTTANLALIGFSTVTLTHWEHLVELFDAIVSGSRWS